MYFHRRQGKVMFSQVSVCPQAVSPLDRLPRRNMGPDRKWHHTSPATYIKLRSLQRSVRILLECILATSIISPVFLFFHRSPLTRWRCLDRRATGQVSSQKVPSSKRTLPRRGSTCHVSTIAGPLASKVIQVRPPSGHIIQSIKVHLCHENLNHWVLVTLS